MSSSVRKFFQGLTDAQKDLFMSVTTDLQASAPEEKLERLRNFHKQLKSEIDTINKRRQGLGDVLNNVNSLIKMISSYMEKHSDLEMAMFLGSLQKVASDLKAEIAALKPEKKLEKKFDVARRMESLQQRQNLSLFLFSDILDAEESVPEVIQEG